MPEPLGDYARRLIQGGVDEDEARLIDSAMSLARSTKSYLSAMGRSSYRTAVRGVGFAGSIADQATGTAALAYRELHGLQVENLDVPTSQLAFSDVDDAVRELNSAFCYLMYRGHQGRFVDRNPEETPEEYIDRPRKATINVTRLVINILSKLYHLSPVREAIGTTSEADAQALDQIWDPLFNRTMLSADRLTRLCGTVAIRPFYDETRPGKIRLWLFLSHQLRIVPHETEPWRAAAVVERINPFDRKTPIRIWTDHSVVTIKGTGPRDATYETHEIGRIPHVFIQDQLSFTSFFSEGRGASLCEPNAILNNDLTDLEEIKQLQGFATLEVVNPVADRIRVGPREGFIFKPKVAGEPYGVKYVSPNAPIVALRADIESQLRNVLRVNGVPEAAVGFESRMRVASGIAIREAMRPIEDDLTERQRIFTPVENDLADSCLRVVSERQESYTYDPAVPPEVRVRYAPLQFPLSTSEQIAKDQFDIATGRATPAEQMHRDDPETFATQEEAITKWTANLNEMAAVGFDPNAGDSPELQADFSKVEEPDNEDESATPLLDLLQDSDLAALLRESAEHVAQANEP